MFDVTIELGEEEEESNLLCGSGQRLLRERDNTDNLNNGFTTQLLDIFNHVDAYFGLLRLFGHTFTTRKMSISDGQNGGKSAGKSHLGRITDGNVCRF